MVFWHSGSIIQNDLSNTAIFINFKAFHGPASIPHQPGAQTDAHSSKGSSCRDIHVKYLQPWLSGSWTSTAWVPKNKTPLGLLVLQQWVPWESRKIRRTRYPWLTWGRYKDSSRWPQGAGHLKGRVYQLTGLPLGREASKQHLKVAIYLPSTVLRSNLSSFCNSHWFSHQKLQTAS